MKVASFNLFHRRLASITLLPVLAMALIFMAGVSLLFYEQHRKDVKWMNDGLVYRITSHANLFATEMYLNQESALNQRMERILLEWRTKFPNGLGCLRIAPNERSGHGMLLNRCTIPAPSDVNWKSPVVRSTPIVVGQTQIAQVQSIVIPQTAWTDFLPPFILITVAISIAVALSIHRLLVGRLNRNILSPLLAEIRSNERNSAIAETTRMIAHDVRKPYLTLQFALKSIKDSTDPKKLALLKEEVVPEVERSMRSVEAMLRDIIEIGSDKEPVKRPISPRYVVGEAVKAIERLNPSSHLVIAKHFQHQRKVSAEPEKIVRVLLNLLENGVHASDGKAGISISTKEVSDGVEFSVTNGGPIIPEEEIEKLFTPFYTKKEKGTGLGLSIVKKIVEAHGGKIWCTSTKESGTTFSFTIPAASTSDLIEPPLPTAETRPVAEERTHEAHR